MSLWKHWIYIFQHWFHLDWTSITFNFQRKISARKNKGPFYSKKKIFWWLLAHLLYFSKNKTRNFMLHNPFLTLPLSIHFSCSCALIATSFITLVHSFPILKCKWWWNTSAYYVTNSMICKLMKTIIWMRCCINFHHVNFHSNWNDQLFNYRFWISTYHYIYNINGCIHPKKI